MKRPSGELLAYGVILAGGGIYMFARLPVTQARFQLVTSALATALIVIGFSLLGRFRWSPELFVAAIAFMFAWSIVHAVLEGYTRGRLILGLTAAAALFGYPALRRQVRDPNLPRDPVS